MKYRSNAPKPETGMEMTVTLSMPADQGAEQSGEALIRFMEGVNKLSAETGAAWIKIHCAGIPEELEARLATAISPSRPRLELVVNNASQPATAGQSMR
jgi:hypothetical protein